MSDLKAIHPKHQATVNRALFHLIKYNEANDLRDKYDGEGDLKNFKVQDSICEKRFHRYESITSELPKREVNNIESSKFY
jgi:hypothetical protein